MSTLHTIYHDLKKYL